MIPNHVLYDGTDSGISQISSDMLNVSSSKSTSDSSQQTSDIQEESSSVFLEIQIIPIILSMYLITNKAKYSKKL